MKAVCDRSLEGNCVDLGLSREHNQDSYLDMDTIRLRVKNIRGSWTAEEKRLRRLEGKLRRDRLENLLFGERLESTHLNENGNFRAN